MIPKSVRRARLTQILRDCIIEMYRKQEWWRRCGWWACWAYELGRRSTRCSQAATWLCEPRVAKLWDSQSGSMDYLAWTLLFSSVSLGFATPCSVVQAADLVLEIVPFWWVSFIVGQSVVVTALVFLRAALRPMSVSTVSSISFRTLIKCKAFTVESSVDAVICRVYP